ncbi:MAG: DMT family transporter [Oceanospirillaceae bacterium]|jgi:drug/metabolite transporter (DMT)-like permease|nr:DMT family transporter [Oceanospirillaceae bacterium]MBT4442864.1 DMT family transporter [Oceanospirillaceae bacterium]MBT6078117.1 DMT family transporter [Oceanospirillaceae bacterium]MBT7329418.1 DMT family transporter [Oceanospirillaceae bacterium]
MKAVFWMLGAIASFCLMAIAARELGGVIDKFELLAIRSLVGVVLLVIIMNVIKRPTLMFSQRTKTHFWRNLFHFIGQFSWLVGIGMLPLAQVFAIEFTVPLWVLIIAAMFLRERITVRKLAAVGLGLIGVAVIVKPGPQLLDTGAIVMLIAALCFAITFILNKSLLRTEHPLTIVFYMTLIQLPLGALMAGADWTMPAPWMWPWVMAIALTGLSAHYCVSKSMQLAEVSVVISLDFLRLPIVATIGMVMYGESFDLAVIVGGAIMLAANLVNHWKSKQVV